MKLLVVLFNADVNLHQVPLQLPIFNSSTAMYIVKVVAVV